MTPDLLVTDGGSHALVLPNSKPQGVGKGTGPFSTHRENGARDKNRESVSVELSQEQSPGFLALP